MVVLSDPYKVLNLPHSATDKEIKQSYRQLARKFHPDTWSQPCFSAAERQQATEKFTEISNAYALLSDEKDKAEYDRTYKFGGYDTKPPAPTATRRSEPAASRPHAAPAAAAPPRTPYAAPPPRRTPSTAPPPPRRVPFKTTPSPRADVWTAAVDPATGRRYYYNQATGQAAPPPGESHGYRNLEENPAHIQHRVDSHPFAAFLALLTCPPIGLLALYYSRTSDAAWEEGRYSQAVHHARQVPQFACLAHVVAIAFWIYWLILREGADFEFPDFDWGEP